MARRLVLFVRHGDYRREPEELTDIGLEQVRSTAGRLAAGPGIDRIVHSTMPRAVQTASLLAAELGIADLRPDEALVDDRPTPALLRIDGATAAWSVSVRGVLVIVAARAVPLDRPALTRVTDLGPLQHRRSLELERYLSEHR